MGKIKTAPITVHIVGPAWAFGGTEQWALLLDKQLDPQRVRITKIHVTDSTMFDTAAAPKDGPPVEFTNPIMLQDATEQADCVIHWGIQSDLFFRPSTRQTRIAIAHGTSDWGIEMLKGSLETSDRIVAVSPLAQRLAASDKFTNCITNAVDPSRLNQTRHPDETKARLGIEDKAWVTGYVGRSVIDKGICVLKEAFTRLSRQNHLLIVTEQRAHDQWTKWAHEHTRGRVTVVSEHHQLGDYYAAMDCFVMPSSHEGFCLATAEAMWCGVPTIMTETGLAPDFIRHGLNGIIINQDPAEIVSRIEQLQTFNSDRQSISAAARETALKEFAPERFGRQWQSTIENGVEAKPNSRLSREVPF